MNDKLKQIIFKKLYSDLGNTEIIVDAHNSIWFINRDEKYWVLELKKRGNLWWRYQFFSSFFKLFSLEQSEYEPLIVEWVEEVLNGRAVSSRRIDHNQEGLVEEVLNGRVVSSKNAGAWHHCAVEEVLNGRVVSSECGSLSVFPLVEEVLNGRVVSSVPSPAGITKQVEEVLNKRVVRSEWGEKVHSQVVEEVLNGKVATFTGVYGS